MKALCIFGFELYNLILWYHKYIGYKIYPKGVFYRFNSELIKKKYCTIIYCIHGNKNSNLNKNLMFNTLSPL